MWSVWLVFCDFGFHSVRLWWIEAYGSFMMGETDCGGVQFSPAAQSCPTLCKAMDCSTTGLPVHHQLLEFTQTHVHRVSCHPTISSSVVSFSSCLQSFPASGSFPMNHSSKCQIWNQTQIWPYIWCSFYYTSLLLPSLLNDKSCIVHWVYRSEVYVQREQIWKNEA